METRGKEVVLPFGLRAQIDPGVVFGRVLERKKVLAFSLALFAGVAFSLLFDVAPWPPKKLGNMGGDGGVEADSMVGSSALFVPLLSAGFGFFVAGIVESLRQTFASAEELADETGLVVLAVLPNFERLTPSPRQLAPSEDS